jgi:hypothetical protein
VSTCLSLRSLEPFSGRNLAVAIFAEEQSLTPLRPSSFSFVVFATHSEKGIKSWSEVRPMSDASQAIKDMHAGKARYRYVLKN